MFQISNPTTKMPSLIQALNLLGMGRYTAFVMRRKDTGLEDGLVLCRKGDDGTLPNMDEFRLEHCHSVMEEQQEPPNIPSASTIISEANQQDTPALSCTMQLTIPQEVHLESSKSITPSLTVPTSTHTPIQPTTPATIRGTEHTLSNTQAALAVSTLTQTSSDEGTLPNLEELRLEDCHSVMEEQQEPPNLPSAPTIIAESNQQDTPALSCPIQLTIPQKVHLESSHSITHSLTVPTSTPFRPSTPSPFRGSEHTLSNTQAALAVSTLIQTSSAPTPPTRERSRQREKVTPVQYHNTSLVAECNDNASSDLCTSVGVGGVQTTLRRSRSRSRNRTRNHCQDKRMVHVQVVFDEDYIGQGESKEIEIEKNLEDKTIRRSRSRNREVRKQLEKLMVHGSKSICSTVLSSDRAVVPSDNVNCSSTSVCDSNQDTTGPEPALASNTALNWSSPRPVQHSSSTEVVGTSLTVANVDASAHTAVSSDGTQTVPSSSGSETSIPRTKQHESHTLESAPTTPGRHKGNKRLSRHLDTVTRGKRLAPKRRKINTGVSIEYEDLHIQLSDSDCNTSLVEPQDSLGISGTQNLGTGGTQASSAHTTTGGTQTSIANTTASTVRVSLSPIPVPPVAPLTANNCNIPKPTTSPVVTSPPSSASLMCHGTVSFRIRMRGQPSVFEVNMMPNAVLERAFAEFGREVGVDQKNLQFCCNGRVLSGDQLASTVEGCKVLVVVRGQRSKRKQPI